MSVKWRGAVSVYRSRHLKWLIKLGGEESDLKEHTPADKHKTSLSHPNTSAAQLLNVTPEIPPGV